MSAERPAANRQEFPPEAYAQTGGPQNWHPELPKNKREHLFFNHARWAWSVLRAVWRQRHA